MSDQEQLRTTPLTEWHLENGAKMAEFAGYSMPINYPSGALKETKAVRENAGMFDISHMRPIVVKGTLARAFLNFIDTRDLASMEPGDAKYGIVCLNNGEAIDDIIVYESPFSTKPSETFIVISNASNGTRVYEHLRQVKSDYSLLNSQVQIEDGLDQFGFISLQGPKAKSILQKAIGSENQIPKKYYSCQYGMVFGYFALLAKTGYTGEEGYEILCPKLDTIEIWTHFLEVGEEDGLVACGLASRDTLRLEAGMPLFGHEMDKNHNPIIAGLGKYVDFNKEGYFLGKGILEKVRDGASKKPNEYFNAFIMEKGRVPRHGNVIYLMLMGETRPVGKLTSAGFSPTLQKNIAMGYTDHSFLPGTTVLIDIGGQMYPATITKLPFYKREKKQ